MRKYIVGTIVLGAIILLFSNEALALSVNDVFMMAGRAADYNEGNVFETIAVRMMKTVGDLRILAYIIAGFGMIAFTWGAIFNKISWKHFGNIMFSLFILSMMTPLIEMVVYGGNSSQELKFGGTSASELAPVGDHGTYTAGSNSSIAPGSGKKGSTQSVPTSPSNGHVQSGGGRGATQSGQSGSQAQSNPGKDSMKGGQSGGQTQGGQSGGQNSGQAQSNPGKGAIQGGQSSAQAQADMGGGTKQDVSNLSTPSSNASASPSTATTGGSDSFHEAQQKTKETADNVRNKTQNAVAQVQKGITVTAAVSSTIGGATRAINNITDTYTRAAAVVNNPNASGMDKANAILGAAGSTVSQTGGAYGTGLNSATTITGVVSPGDANAVYQTGRDIYGIISDVPSAAVSSANAVNSTIGNAGSTANNLYNTIKGLESIGR